MVFRSLEDDEAGGFYESKTEDFSEPVNIMGRAGFNAKLHDVRFSTPVGHSSGNAQRFGDSISPIDYYNVSPNLSHLIQPRTPKSYTSHYNRRKVQRTP